MANDRANDTLRGLIQRTGLSINAFAQAAGITDRQLRNLLAGRHLRPRWETREAIERTLRQNGVAVEGAQNLGFDTSSRRTVTTGAEPEDETVEILRRELLGLTATAAFSGTLGGALADTVRITPTSRNTTRMVGAADVDRMRETFEYISGTGSLMGGGVLSDTALVDTFRSALGMLHGRFRSAEVRAAAHAVVGNLSQTVGFQLYDQCRHTLARRVWITGLNVARDAGEESASCQSYLLHCMAHQEHFLGNPHDGLGLLGLISNKELSLSGQTRSMINVMRAQCAAAVGDHAGTLSYVAAADTLFDESEQPDSWNARGWYDRSAVDGSNGRALTALALTHEDLRDDALRRVAQAADRYKPSEQRTIARELISATRLHAVRGDAPSAATAAAQVMDTTRHLQSARVHREVRDLLTALRPLRRNGDVAQVMQEITHCAV